MSNANHELIKDDILETQAPGFTRERVKEIATKSFWSNRRPIFSQQ